MAKTDLREWAVKGAEQRLVELAQEARAIFVVFPELRAPGRGFGANRGDSVGAAQVKLGQRHRRMSAAARKKVSLAQKKRWAEWRKKQGKSH